MVDEDVTRLPLAHATALRMHRAGMGTDDIAIALGIEVEGVAPLLDVARAKLSRLQCGPDGTAPDPATEEVAGDLPHDDLG